MQGESDLRLARGDADVLGAGCNIQNGRSDTATIPNVGAVTFSCGAGAVTTVSLDVPNTGRRPPGAVDSGFSSRTGTSLP